MNGISVSMAIVDFIPVLMFFIATIILQRDLYNKMVKGAYSLLAAGSWMILIGGTYKALWKILYGLGICDYPNLTASFFPMQGPGFILIAIALIGMFTKYNKNAFLSIMVVPVYNSNMPFIFLQVIGCSVVQFSLAYISVKMRQKFCTLLFIISFIFMLGMGYLGSKFDDSSSMHWIAQCTNIISQGTFLWGTIILHKKGLREKNIFIIR